MGKELEKKEKVMHPDNVRRNKIKTLNNILCMINDEIKIVKTINESEQKEQFEKNSIKKLAIENIQMLSGSFNILNDGEV